MSIPKFSVPKFLKPYRQQSSQQPQTSQFTDATRRGSEYCPYCGGYHSTDAERRACADAHSSIDSQYRCPRCGQYHDTLYAAEHCCDEEKRYERKYDPQTYAGYTSGYGSEPAETGSSWYPGRQSTSSGGSSGESIFESLFNFGGNKETEHEQSSGGGILDSFFNAGGGGNKKGGGGFFG